ncbi:MAG: TRAP transporter small permease [Alphaproteobacteria bacterium]|nr:TRAP transporter small permease [Alphaproteobacteria bacterium]
MILRRLIAFPIEDWIGTALLAVILVVLSAEIVIRYVFGNSLFWYDELSRYCLISLTFLGCATGVRKRCHVRIDLIDFLLPEAWRRRLTTVVDAIVLAYLLYVGYAAWKVAGILVTSPSAALGVPMGYVYMAIVAGFGLAAFRLVLLYLDGPADHER